jgi:formylglycine-generating enzyme required for sulfatase activity
VKNKTWLVLLASAFAAFAAVFAVTRMLQPKSESTPSAESPPGMVWIVGGEFVMGSDHAGAPKVELPAHRVRLDGFWIDEHEVTNAEFRQFVEATGYVTTAERPPRKGVSPGSLVFIPTPGPVPLDDATLWWRWTEGACWQHPEGPGSNLDGRDDHPVVQVSWDDAVAYVTWAGKRLPTEAEWEFAARGGLAGKKFTWGDDPPAEDVKLANIWQGDFPHRNVKIDGFERTSPVKSYPANGYGLYDMAGNVWEWCNDWYRPDAYTLLPPLATNPQGPAAAWDPRSKNSIQRVTRGGSFLCHVSYCESYRPGARRGTDYDTGMSHIGFRCVKSATK